MSAGESTVDNEKRRHSDTKQKIVGQVETSQEAIKQLRFTAVADVPAVASPISLGDNTSTYPADVVATSRRRLRSRFSFLRTAPPPPAAGSRVASAAAASSVVVVVVALPTRFNRQDVQPGGWRVQFTDRVWLVDVTRWRCPQQQQQLVLQPATDFRRNYVERILLSPSRWSRRVHVVSAAGGGRSCSSRYGRQRRNVRRATRWNRCWSRGLFKFCRSI